MNLLNDDFIKILLIILPLNKNNARFLNTSLSSNQFKGETPYNRSAIAIA